MKTHNTICNFSIYWTNKIFIYARFLSEIIIFLNDILGVYKSVCKSSWKDISFENEYKMLTKEKSKASLSIN